MPTFCRHNRLLQNCPICAREQAVELAPVISPGSPSARESDASRPRSPRAATRSRGAARRPRAAAASGMRVRRLNRGPDDGYDHPLVPGLHSSAEASRLADELAFAAGRLDRLGSAPPGLYAEVADPAGEIEERTWLGFLIAYLAPLAEDDPFTEIAARRTSWSSGRLPDLDGLRTGPRSPHDPAHGSRTLEAYRAWARRAGSQQQALAGDAVWSPERRFARAYERLALPGMTRGARFELLASLGALGAHALDAGTLILGGADEVTLAAKRVLGIGETMLLQRRAEDLAEGCGVPLAALDLALHNWQLAGEERALGGLEPGADAGAGRRADVRRSLGLG
jgi:hypothetical protein